MKVVCLLSTLLLCSGMAHAQSNATPSPGFPVGLSGIDELHAAFLGESRTSENVKGSVQETPSEPKAPQSFDMTAVDKTADPCTDFYQYACGNWQKNNPIPPDQVKWGEFTELRERTSWLLYEELEEAAQPNPTRTPLEQKYGDFYAAISRLKPDAGAAGGYRYTDGSPWGNRTCGRRRASLGNGAES